MEQGFFVGFDNDMEDFSNLIGGGKLAQKYKDLKTATGGKNIIGAGLRGALDPKKTANKLKDISTARANTPTPPVPPTTPPTEDNSGSGSDSGSGSSGSGDSGSGSGNDTKSLGSGEGMSTAMKIGIGVGALLLVGGIVFLVMRRKK